MGEQEALVELVKLDNKDLQAVNKVKETMDLSNSNGIVAFGSEVQSNIAKFADSILKDVKTKDTGVVGENLTSLMTTIKGVDMDKLQKKESLIDKIPILRDIMGTITAEKIKLESVSDTVDKIVVSLEGARAELIRDVNVLDALYEKNLDHMHDLEIYIEAGNQKHKELSETVLVDLREKAEKTKDMVAIQRYNDFEQLLNEIEKRVYDLKLSREISIQTMPQIRLLQTNNKILAGKIQSSILTTIPIWKNQIALTISLNKQKTALELQRKVSDTTEDLLKRNAELLKTNSLQIARESERGVISIETLRETHAKLIETIEESMKIYAEGRDKRHAVEIELKKLEETQKQKLLPLKSEK